MNRLSWYKIPELPVSGYLKACEGLYDVVEGKNKSKSEEDPFIKAVIMGNIGMTDDAFKKAEEARLKQKALEMKMGDFHEELMGKFPGWETLPNGHSSGFDVRKVDNTTFLEVKNRHNTIKGSDGKHIIESMQRHKANGKTVILVQVNCPKGKVSRYGAPADVPIMNGTQAYEYLSGRNAFFDDLLKTLQYTFTTYKTHDSLKTALEIA